MYEVLTNPIEQDGQRVLTTAQLAEYYETDTKVILKNFNRNRDRFIEGKHFYCLTGDELKEFKATRQNDDQLKFAPSIYLWTEKGALLHAKSLNTDKAWEVHDFLIDTYFRVQELKTSYTDTLLNMYQEQNERYNELLSRMEKLESKQTKTRKKIEQNCYSACSFSLSSCIVFNIYSFSRAFAVVPCCSACSLNFSACSFRRLQPRVAIFFLFHLSRAFFCDSLTLI